MTDAAGVTVSGPVSVSVAPDAKKHAADIMVQACVAFLTLSSLLCTALLAFTGSILGAPGVNPGFTPLAFLSGLIFLICISVAIQTLYKSVALADTGQLLVEDRAIRDRMLWITWSFAIAIAVGVAYLLSVSFFRAGS